MENMPDSRPSVLIFATGGTIGMHETPQGLAVDPGFDAALESLVESICDALGATYRVNHMQPAIDSSNSDAETPLRIARAVQARVRTNKPTGVVITHGTDTLAYTGARLAFELADLDCPVVITGSMLPHAFANSDARGNLQLAITTALQSQHDAPVSIAFGGAKMPAIRATKVDTQSMQAFRAERGLGVNPSGIPEQLSQAIAHRERRAPARVISVRFVPGMIADDLRAAVGGNPDGLVLECYGSGNAPMSRPGMGEVLQEICARIPVVAVTQCAAGGVDAGRYAIGGELMATGVIDGADMTLEAALAKLGFGLDAGLAGAPLKTFMQLNLVGERS